MKTCFFFNFLSTPKKNIFVGPKMCPFGNVRAKRIAIEHQNIFKKKVNFPKVFGSILEGISEPKSKKPNIFKYILKRLKIGKTVRELFKYIFKNISSTSICHKNSRFFKNLSSRIVNVLQSMSHFLFPAIYSHHFLGIEKKVIFLLYDCRRVDFINCLFLL